METAKTTKETQRRTQGPTTVGLEYRFKHRPGRPKNNGNLAILPHWTDITLTTGVLLGELFPLHLLDDYADDSNFLYRLYTCFKEPLKLDQYTFQKSKLYPAERVIVEAVNHYFKKAAMILETPADYSDQSEGFMVLWEIPQPASGFHTLYLKDIYLCKDDLVQQVLYEGMRIMCWRIYFGSWHGPYMDMVEHVAKQIWKRQ
jgi:hypothetical protein